MKNYDIYKQQIEGINNDLRQHIKDQFNWFDSQKLVYNYCGSKSLQVDNKISIIYDNAEAIYKINNEYYSKILMQTDDCNLLNYIFGQLNDKIFTIIDKYLKNILIGIKELSFEPLDYNILTDQGRNIISIKLENDTIYVNIANNNFLLDQLKNYEFNIQINIYQATIDITNLLISNLLRIKNDCK
jgi:hypothetical protein